MGYNSLKSKQHFCATLSLVSTTLPFSLSFPQLFHSLSRFNNSSTLSLVSTTLPFSLSRFNNSSMLSLVSTPLPFSLSFQQLFHSLSRFNNSSILFFVSTTLPFSLSLQQLFHSLSRFNNSSNYISGLHTVKALRFTQNPPGRISKTAGEKVELTWKFAIDKPSELVRLECGYLNSSRQMMKLIEQLSTETQPRITTLGTRFHNRASVMNGALVITGLQVGDTGIYYCVLKAYDAMTFRTVTIKSIDSYLSVGGSFSALFPVLFTEF